MSTDKIDLMLADPKAHGFDWEYGALHSGDVQIIKEAPFIKHMNVALMTAHFGEDYFLNSANGQSARVRDQRVVRDAVVADRKLASKPDDLKRLVLEAALGMRPRRGRTVVEKRIYVASDDTEFEDKEAWKAYEASLQARK